MIVKVCEKIKTAFSLEDAEVISKILRTALEAKDKDVIIELDFDGVRYFTTLFFNNAIVKFVGEIGPERYFEVFKLKNLSDVGMTTYKHSLESAKEYYALSEEEKNKFDEILSENMADID